MKVSEPVNDLFFKVVINLKYFSKTKTAKDKFERFNGDIIKF